MVFEMGDHAYADDLFPGVVVPPVGTPFLVCGHLGGPMVPMGRVSAGRPVSVSGAPTMFGRALFVTHWVSGGSHKAVRGGNPVGPRTVVPRSKSGRCRSWVSTRLRA
jgi:hypothetical protein